MPAPRLDWDHVRVFLAVARAGGQGRAAAGLQQSEATIGRHLAALEATLAAPLFDRLPNRLALTPLGTRLRARYERDVRPLARGDLLVLYTDGLIESINDAGREYGDARLARAISRAEGGRTAREIRDAILEDLSSFKGDADQLDDITVVVVRLR